MDFNTKRKFIPNGFIAASRKPLLPFHLPHLHDFFEIEFIISGKGICCVDGKEYCFSEGSFFFLSPINIHEIKSADAEIINVMFEFEIAEKSFSKPIIGVSQCPMIQLEGEAMSFVYQLLSELVSCYKQDLEYASLLLTCVLKKIEKLMGDTCDDQLNYIQHALLYITKNFRNKVTLSSTAKQIGLTPTYFSNVFKKETGMNFSTYLDNVRFSYAKNLLCFTDFSVLNIVQMSGFEDYANFAKRFKRLFGVTPGEFRKHIG
jgi:AraC-like DNA-binding protein